MFLFIIIWIPLYIILMNAESMEDSKVALSVLYYGVIGLICVGMMVYVFMFS